MTRHCVNAARTIAVAVLPGLLLAACSSLPSNPGVPDIYQLSPIGAQAGEAAEPAAVGRLPWQIVVEAPMAPLSLDTNRIALQTGKHEVKYIRGARWSDNAPKLVQTALVESLEATRRFAAVGRPSGGLHADYALVCELRDFEADLHSDNRPVVRISLMTSLIKTPAGAAAASHLFSNATKAGGSGRLAIIRAFDTGLQDLMHEVGDWTQASLPSHEPDARAASRSETAAQAN